MQSAPFAKMQDYFKNQPQRVYPKGQIILFAGEVPRYGFLLSDGQVRVYDITPSGDEVVVDVITAPAFFPLSWALNKTPNRFFYKTGVRSTAYLLPFSQFIQYLQTHTDLLVELLASIQQNLDDAFDRMVYSMSGTAQSKLVHVLLLECMQDGSPTQHVDYVIRTKSSEIAARAGLARETVSRELKKLGQNNIVQVANRQIHIPDIGALEQALQTIQTPFSPPLDSYHRLKLSRIKEQPPPL